MSKVTIQSDLITSKFWQGVGTGLKELLDENGLDYAVTITPRTLEQKKAEREEAKRDGRGACPHDATVDVATKTVSIVVSDSEDFYFFPDDKLTPLDFADELFQDIEATIEAEEMKRSSNQ